MITGVTPPPPPALQDLMGVTGQMEERGPPVETGVTVATDKPVKRETAAIPAGKETTVEAGIRAAGALTVSTGCWAATGLRVGPGVREPQVNIGC